jgi:hypothetical protein
MEVTLNFAVCTLALAGGAIMTTSPRQQASTPFGADFLEIRAVKAASGGVRETRRSGKMYRDRFGRLRQDVTVELGPNERTTVAVLIDPIGPVVKLLRGEPGRVADAIGPLEDLAKAIPAPTSSAAIQQPFESKDLGKKSIEGILCGGHSVQRGDKVIETWTCAEMAGQPILVKSTSPTAEYSLRLFNIRLEDPDPKLFDVDR